MGKKVYTINGKMYIFNDETGDIQTIHIVDDQIPPAELKEIIRFFVKNDKKNDDSD